MIHLTVVPVVNLTVATPGKNCRDVSKGFMLTALLSQRWGAGPTVRLQPHFLPLSSAVCSLSHWASLCFYNGHGDGSHWPSPTGDAQLFTWQEALSSDQSGFWKPPDQADSNPLGGGPGSGGGGLGQLGVSVRDGRGSRLASHQTVEQFRRYQVFVCPWALLPSSPCSTHI